MTERPDSFHLVIDVVELEHVLAPEPLPETVHPRVVGPFDLHVFSQLRKRRSVQGREAIAADYFIWGSGEPPHRAMTKLGGVPYLPASVAWPERDGTTGDFYAQINFIDSRDILPSLPGDVLLIFRFHDLDCTSWDEELYEFIWVDFQEQDLIAAEHVHCSNSGVKNPWPIMHGYRVRSFDFPGVADDSLDANLRNANATKIGGVATDPAHQQGPEVPGDYRFLGQVVGVWPSVKTPYPVVTRAAPVPLTPPFTEYRELCSGPDDGITCLYLDRLGKVRVYFNCT